jgi:uncharacterized membrane-anchored protein
MLLDQSCVHSRIARRLDDELQVWKNSDRNARIYFLLAPLSIWKYSATARTLCIDRIQAASSRSQFYLAIQFLTSLLRSEGASENSPQFQLRVNATKKPKPRRGDR